MRRHHLKLASLWILPLLLARALIPSGFMLSAGGGGLQLMFCPAGVVQPMGLQQADVAHHEGMHQGDAGEAAASHNNDNAPCPFSLVISAASGEIPPLQAAANGPGSEVFTFISAPTFRVGPLRADRIRGPPVLS